MVKQVRKRPSTAKGGSQRKKRGLTENDEAGYDAFFLASDDEGRSGRDASGDEEDTEDLETAEEKRLRLGKSRCTPNTSTANEDDTNYSS